MIINSYDSPFLLGKLGGIILILLRYSKFVPGKKIEVKIESRANDLAYIIYGTHLVLYSI